MWWMKWNRIDMWWNNMWEMTWNRIEMKWDEMYNEKNDIWYVMKWKWKDMLGNEWNNIW